MTSWGQKQNLTSRVNILYYLKYSSFKKNIGHATKHKGMAYRRHVVVWDGGGGDQ